MASREKEQEEEKKKKSDSLHGIRADYSKSCVTGD